MKSEDHPVIRALRRSDVLARKFIDYLVENGRAYTGVPLPCGVGRWPVGSCIEASEHLKNRHGLARAQGWCLAPRSVARSGQPFWHTFNTDDGQNAIDASLPAAEECHYFGLAGPFENPDNFDTMVIGAPKKPRDMVPLDLLPGVLTRRLFPPIRLL